MPSRRRILGTFGEQAAANFLIRQGYCILAHSWRCASGELDLVAQLGDQIVFVEVRTRRGDADSTPEESITRVKRVRLAALAYAYLDAHNLPETSLWRIDLIALVLDRSGRITRLTHLEHAVEAEE